jgi:hypothetical protein
MWDLLKKSDIEQEKKALKLLRAETLRRHAVESQILDADRAELEQLSHLIDIFVQKFVKPSILLQEMIPSPLSNTGEQISPAIIHRPQPQPQHRRHRHQTVFETFARAMARG